MSKNRVESERAYSWAETAVCRRLLAVAAAAVVLIGVADAVVVVVVVIVVAVVVVLVLVLVLALLLSVVVMLMLMMMLIAPGDLRLRTLRPMDCFSSSTDVSDAGPNCRTTGAGMPATCAVEYNNAEHTHARQREESTTSWANYLRHRGYLRHGTLSYTGRESASQGARGRGTMSYTGRESASKVQGARGSYSP